MTRGILGHWIATILVLGTLLCPLWGQNEVHFQILPHEQDFSPGSELVLTLRGPPWPQPGTSIP